MPSVTAARPEEASCTNSSTRRGPRSSRLRSTCVQCSRFLGALPDLAAEDLLAALHVDAHGGVDGGRHEAPAAAHPDLLGVHADDEAVGVEGAGVEQGEFLGESVDDMLQVGFGHRDAHLAEGAPHAVDGANRGERGEDVFLGRLGAAPVTAGGQHLGTERAAAGVWEPHRVGHAADVGDALEDPVGELRVVVAQMGSPFPETDAGEHHAEQLAQGLGSQVYRVVTKRV